MDIFGIKFKRLCEQLKSEGFTELRGIGCFTDSEFYHRDGRKMQVRRGLFPKIYQVPNDFAKYYH
ncbi:MAG: hypothetical protein WCY37_05005 [Candidatus Dojkabacteria bacterium]